MATSSKQALKSALKSGHGGGYLTEADGRHWIGTSYWTHEVDQAARDLLGAYNLSVDDAPAWLTVNGTVQVNPDKAAPDRLEQVVTPPAETVDLEQVTVEGYDATLTLPEGVEVVPLRRPADRGDSPGALVVVNQSFNDLIVRAVAPDAIRQVQDGNEPELKPVFYLRGGIVVGVLMPIRRT